MDPVKTFERAIGADTRYRALNAIIWLSAITSWGAVLIYHACNLSHQFMWQDTAVNIKYVDNITDGIRLPNGTLCLQLKDFYAVDIIFKAFTSFQNKYYATEGGNYNLKNLTISWPNENFDIKLNYSHVMNQEAEKFWGFFCKTIGLKMFFTHSYGKHPLRDTCNSMTLAEKKAFLTDYNRCKRLCFRLTLNEFLFKKQKVNVIDDFKYLSNDMLSVKIDISSIMSIFNRNLSSIFIYVPEQPLSYIQEIDDDAKIALKNMDDVQFFYEVKNERCLKPYGKCNIEVDAYVTRKYVSKNSNTGCTDVYDQTRCIIECRRDLFWKLCKCRRFIMNGFDDNEYELCSNELQVNCSQKYKSMIQDGSLEEFQCEDHCSKCGKLIFGFDVKKEIRQPLQTSCGLIAEKFAFLFSVTCPFGVETVDPDEVLERNPVVLNTLKQMLENLKIIKDIQNVYNYKDFKKMTTQNEMAMRLFSNLISHDNKFHDYKNVSMENISKMLNEETYRKFYELYELALEFENLELFGTVQFDMSVSSFKYPIYTEIDTMSTEEFFSQVGGIMGMYLGISGLTVFIAVIKFMRLMRKNYKQKVIMTTAQSRNTSAILEFWKYITPLIMDDEQDYTSRSQNSAFDVQLVAPNNAMEKTMDGFKKEMEKLAIENTALYRKIFELEQTVQLLKNNARDSSL